MDTRNIGSLLVIVLLVFAATFFMGRDRKSNGDKRQQYEQQLDSARTSKTFEQTAVTELGSVSGLGLESIDQDVVLANNLVKVVLSSKGGVPQYVELYEYKDQQGENVVLFNDEEMSLNVKIDGKMRNISTKDLYFETIAPGQGNAIMRLKTDFGGWIDFEYNLHPDSYVLDLNITAHGMQDFFPSDLNHISIDWIQNLRQQEKGFEFEQRYTTLTYKRNDQAKSKYVNVTKDTKTEHPQEALDWIAFKNQFFSTILISQGTFAADCQLTSMPYKKGVGYMKKMMAKVQTPFDPQGNEPTCLSFYLGPNDYKVLRKSSAMVSYNHKMRLHRVVDLGWPVVREVNRFIIIPLFNLLAGWNMNMGLVILLLTIIIKIIVYPFTYKSYMSSAKMRALKPYVDEINKKYPKQEDAMRKQQETMSLYSKYGVSPMGGCLPSLIQMPFWMALFFFVPNAIELRQQSFLWAADLTGFDDIIHWNANIPLIGNHLSIFCILFCASNVINTVFSMRQQSQAPGQEQSMQMMKWMMYLMPVIFFFTFNNYSSGLNYYYFISALTSILIMIYLRRSTDDAKILAQLEANYKSKQADSGQKPKMNSMMARLEAMRAEQERLEKMKK